MCLDAARVPQIWERMLLKGRLCEGLGMGLCLGVQLGPALSRIYAINEVLGLIFIIIVVLTPK